MLVDGIPETEQVVRAVFEPRGMQVTRLDPSRNTELSRSEVRHTVDLVIIDEEDGAEQPMDAGRSDWSQSCRVVIGSARCPAEQTAGQQYLRKPFQYAELIRAIERLLEPKPVPGTDG